VGSGAGRAGAGDAPAAETVLVQRIRRRIDCALIIPMIIQTTELSLSGSNQVDAAPNVSRHDPTRTVWFDAEHLPHNRTSWIRTHLELKNHRWVRQRSCCNVSPLVN
jgi:hypothetical protein